MKKKACRANITDYMSSAVPVEVAWNCPGLQLPSILTHHFEESFQLSKIDIDKHRAAKQAALSR